MQTVFLWSAAVASIVTFSVHTFVGGVFVARPLLAETGMPKAAKWITYMCWHITSVAIVAMGGAYAYSAVLPERLELAVFATGLIGACAILSGAVAIMGGFHPLRFPSTLLLGATACLGLAGLLAG